MIVLSEDDYESSVRAKIASSLKGQYSLLAPEENFSAKVGRKHWIQLQCCLETGRARTPLYSYKTGIWFCSKWTCWVSTRPVSSYWPKCQRVLPANSTIHQWHYISGSTSTITAQRDGFTLPTTSTFQMVGLISTTTPICQTYWQDSGTEFYGKIISKFPASVIAEPTEMLRYFQRNEMQQYSWETPISLLLTVPKSWTRHFKSWYQYRGRIQE